MFAWHCVIQQFPLKQVTEESREKGKNAVLILRRYNFLGDPGMSSGKSLFCTGNDKTRSDNTVTIGSSRTRLYIDGNKSLYFHGLWEGTVQVKTE